MAVIATDVWLKDYLTEGKKPVMEVHRSLLCEKLVSYFDDATSREIQHHLMEHGLFLPGLSNKRVIDEMMEKDYWRWAKLEYKQLRREWNGPDVPIFIFPSNLRNSQFRSELNGKTGLAYRDKVFLFIAPHTSRLELRALLTHEYNHVRRLHYLNQQEDKIELLDSIILEGLAERAVYERLGSEYTAKWTSIYSKETAEKGWEKWVKPNINVKKADIRHRYLMYGNRQIPRWLGYNIGYHLVTSFAENSGKPMNVLLQTPAKQILEGAAFA